ncbi:cell filamentation protein Fic [Candidatus Termititenax aidoneus]|uniref:Cell filamentation protein Fic n=1 Tax=Termititenax aidoneus TaxID=2218524 RepID=A0A388T8J5_TERA1|nr:cell filamentation protein Fic [Candidatus Termititenax aidoneus]
MRRYIWQNKNWQNFRPAGQELAELVAQARFLQGQLLGKISALNLRLQTEAQGELLLAETLQTAKIESLELNIESVRSSVAARLGLPQGFGRPIDRSVDGLVEVLLDAVRQHAQPLTLARLNGWHAALFPTGFSGLRRISAGAPRQVGMQVVSGYLGHEKIHYEAPPAKQVKKELAVFFKWFKQSAGQSNGLLRAADAHFKFITIHPYDDGNGRLARVITDLAMAQDENATFRAYSLSAQIMRERQAYYQILENTQRGTQRLDDWREWFLKMFYNALQNSQEIISAAFRKAAFWNTIQDTVLNSRQRKVIQKMLDLGKFEGGLTTRKYTAMTKTSPATSAREIAYLYRQKILKQFGQGRSVRYELNLPRLS